jgi:hypothetical protein
LFGPHVLPIRTSLVGIGPILLGRMFYNLHFHSLRSKHGDFAWYHKKFKHDDALLQCSCGRTKTPEHIVHCRKMAASFNKWPLRPTSPPSTPKEGLEYLALLLSQPRDFEALLRLTNFYSKICTR